MLRIKTVCVFSFSLYLFVVKLICVYGRSISFIICLQMFTIQFFLTGKFVLNLFSVRSAPANPPKSMKNIEKNQSSSHTSLSPPATSDHCSGGAQMHARVHRAVKTS